MRFSQLLVLLICYSTSLAQAFRLLRPFGSKGHRGAVLFMASSQDWDGPGGPPSPEKEPERTGGQGEWADWDNNDAFIGDMYEPGDDEDQQGGGGFVRLSQEFSSVIEDLPIEVPTPTKPEWKPGSGGRGRDENWSFARENEFGISETGPSPWSEEPPFFDDDDIEEEGNGKGYGGEKGFVSGSSDLFYTRKLVDESPSAPPSTTSTSSSSSSTTAGGISSSSSSAVVVNGVDIITRLDRMERMAESLSRELGNFKVIVALLTGIAIGSSLFR